MHLRSTACRGRLGPRAQAHSRRKRRRKLGVLEGAVVEPRALQLERRRWAHEAMQLWRLRRVSAFLATASRPATTDGPVATYETDLRTQLTSSQLYNC